MFLGFKQTSQNLSVLTCSLSLLSYTGSELEQILISWQTEDFKYENKTIGNLLVLELKKKKKNTHSREDLKMWGLHVGDFMVWEQLHKLFDSRKN